jgi:hypothetical protein
VLSIVRRLIIDSKAVVLKKVVDASMRWRDEGAATLGRVDPAYVTIRAAVNDVELAGFLVPKHQ